MSNVNTISDSTLKSIETLMNQETEAKRVVIEATATLKAIRASRRQVQQTTKDALRAITPRRPRRNHQEDTEAIS